MGDFSPYIAAINAPLQSDKFYRTALTSILPAHKARIFNSGTAADGSKIGTYEKATARRKAKAGRESSFVNLRDSDKMMMGYTLHTITPMKEYGYGFESQEDFDKTQWNEARYSKSIFALSAKENTDLATVVDRQLVDEHRKRGINMETL